MSFRLFGVDKKKKTLPSTKRIENNSTRQTSAPTAQRLTGTLAEILVRSAGASECSVPRGVQRITVVHGTPEQTNVRERDKK